MHCPFEASGECKRAKCHLWVTEEEQAAAVQADGYRAIASNSLKACCALRLTALTQLLLRRLSDLTEIVENSLAVRS